MTYPPFIKDLPVCIDFDGVLAECTYPSPELGRSIQAGIDLLLHYYNQGCEVVILTSRPESHWPRIWKWLDEVGLHGMVYDVTGTKIRAGLYVDDRAIRFPLEDPVAYPPDPKFPIQMNLLNDEVEVPWGDYPSLPLEVIADTEPEEDEEPGTVWERESFRMILGMPYDEEAMAEAWESVQFLPPRHPSSDRFHQILGELGELHERLVNEQEPTESEEWLLTTTAHEIALLASADYRWKTFGLKVDKREDDTIVARIAMDSTSDDGGKTTQRSTSHTSSGTESATKYDSVNTESPEKITTECCESKETFAPSAGRLIDRLTPTPTLSDSFTLTMMQEQDVSGLFSVLSATPESGSSDTMQFSCFAPQGTFANTTARRVFERMVSLVLLSAAKQKGYGTDEDPLANVRSSAEWGMPAWVGALLRGQDKIKRLQAFAKKGELPFESVEDAFKDLAVYAVLGLILFEQEQAAKV